MSIEFKNHNTPSPDQLNIDEVNPTELTDDELQKLKEETSEETILLEKQAQKKLDEYYKKGIGINRPVKGGEPVKLNPINTIEDDSFDPGDYQNMLRNPNSAGKNKTLEMVGEDKKKKTQEEKNEGMMRGISKAVENRNPHEDRFKMKDPLDPEL